MNRSCKTILAASIAPIALLVIVPPHSTWADAIFGPADPILGGKQDTTLNAFQIGVIGTAAGANNWPGAESPDHVIDGAQQKYLNFGQAFTGFLVHPNFNGGNGAIASSMKLWTANDAPERDPASYQIWGSNDTLDFSSTSFDLNTFTQISSGALALPTGRNNTGTLLDANSQTVSFSNINGYKNFLIVFPSVRTSSANSMQIAEVQLFGIAAFINLTWTGSTTSIWNIATTQNWSAGGAASTYSDTNGVTFDDTANATRTNITVQAGGAGVKPAAVLFQNNTLNYTIGGEPIVSPGTLTLNGTATVTLNNSNSYALGTTVNAGTLTLGATGSLGNNPLAVNNSNTGAGRAVIVNFSSAQTIGTLSGAISTPSSGTNTATINLNGDLTVEQGAGGAFGGVMAGLGGLIKSGPGVLTLSGVNTYSGPTTVNVGTLRTSAPGDNPQGALPAGKLVVVNAGATLLFGADDGAGYYAGSVAGITVNGGTISGGPNTHSTLPGLTLSGATLSAADAGNTVSGVKVNYILDGNVTTVAGASPTTFTAPTILLRNNPSNTNTSAPVTFNVPRGTADVDLDIQSVILDKGAGFIKTGNGILALGNANPYFGPTVINGGKLVIGSSDALGLGNVTIGNGAILSMKKPPSFSGFAGFSLNGGATADAANSVITLTDNGGSEARSAFSTAQVGFASGFAASFVYTAGGARAADGFTFTIQNSSPTAVGGGGGALGYVGIPNSAALQFNIYTGGGQPIGTNVNSGASGGYVSSAPVNLASGNPILINVQFDAAAHTITESLLDQVTNDSYSKIFSNIDLPSTIGSNLGYVGFTGGTGGAVASQTVGNFTFGSASPGVSLSNTIRVLTGTTAGLEIQPNTDSTIALGNIDGLMRIDANGALNVTGGATATNSPYQLTLAGSTALSGNSTISVANNGTGTGTVLANSPIDELTAANLIKAGSGTLILASDNSYSGTTTVNAGTLLVTGSISGSTTTVNNTGTLAGNGTVTAVTVATGGTLAPGIGSAGTINAGPLTLQNGSTFSLDIGSTNADQVKVNGAATLAGNIPLLLTLTADPTDGQVFTIIDGSASLIGYSGGARFTYLGNSLAEGQTFAVTSGGFTQPFVISYAADSGRDVTLVAVPEPGVVGSLLLGLCLPLAVWRRRKAV